MDEDGCECRLSDLGALARAMRKGYYCRDVVSRESAIPRNQPFTLERALHKDGYGVSGAGRILE